MTLQRVYTRRTAHTDRLVSAFVGPIIASGPLLQDWWEDAARDLSDILTAIEWIGVSHLNAEWEQRRLALATASQNYDRANDVPF